MRIIFNQFILFHWVSSKISQKFRCNNCVMCRKCPKLYMCRMGSKIDRHQNMTSQSKPKPKLGNENSTITLWILLWIAYTFAMMATNLQHATTRAELELKWVLGPALIDNLMKMDIPKWPKKASPEMQWRLFSGGFFRT